MNAKAGIVLLLATAGVFGVAPSGWAQWMTRTVTTYKVVPTYGWVPTTAWQTRDVAEGQYAVAAGPESDANGAVGRAVAFSSGAGTGERRQEPSAWVARKLAASLDARGIQSIRKAGSVLDFRDLGGLWTASSGENVLFAVRIQSSSVILAPVNSAGGVDRAAAATLPLDPAMKLRPGSKFSNSAFSVEIDSMSGGEKNPTLVGKFHDSLTGQSAEQVELSPAEQ